MKDNPSQLWVLGYNKNSIKMLNISQYINSSFKRRMLLLLQFLIIYRFGFSESEICIINLYSSTVILYLKLSIYRKFLNICCWWWYLPIQLYIETTFDLQHSLLILMAVCNTDGFSMAKFCSTRLQSKRCKGTNLRDPCCWHRNCSEGCTVDDYNVPSLASFDLTEEVMKLVSLFRLEFFFWFLWSPFTSCNACTGGEYISIANTMSYTI